MATFTYPTATANYNGGKPAIGRDVRDDLDEIRTFIVGNNLEGSNLANTTVAEVNLTTAVAEKLLFTGIIQMYGAGNAPTGWLICDGQAVSRTTYSSLFAIVNTIYGVGDGATTFNVPDMRGRYPRGQNNATTPNGINASFTETRNLGEFTGNEFSPLVAAHIPAHTHPAGSHTHSGTTAAHSHTWSTGGAGTTPGYGSDSTDSNNNITVPMTTDPGLAFTTGSGSGATGSTGSGSPFGVLNPLMAVNFIIKT